LDAVAAANPALAGAIGRGHELFDELVPDDVADVVHACHTDPEPLADAMAAGGTTLAHGDFFFVNVALERQRVTPLDWGLATAGPAPLDLVTFCLGAMSNVAMRRDELLQEARGACRDLVDDTTFSLFALFALLELGWNKALDAIDHPDPAKRATERADLDFWVTRARDALEVSGHGT
jgi:aminoglycoside phosphotransferase (APT) family kinase protein